jgi:hypothetical protein
MRAVGARGEVGVGVSFGPTSSPLLAHAVSLALEHADTIEQLRSGTWEATFRLEAAERAYGSLRELLRLVQGWKSTRVAVDGWPEARQVVLSMLWCSREWLRVRGSCGATFSSPRGAPRCRLCPLYDPAHAAEFWVHPAFTMQEREAPDYVPEEWTGP